MSFSIFLWNTMIKGAHLSKTYRLTFQTVYSISLVLLPPHRLTRRPRWYSWSRKAKKYQHSRISSGAMLMQRFTTIFWDITSWSPLKVNRSFGGTRRLYLQKMETFLRNLRRLSVDYKALYPRRQHSSACSLSIFSFRNRTAFVPWVYRCVWKT
jgi:hypothetical protein